LGLPGPEIERDEAPIPPNHEENSEEPQHPPVIADVFPERGDGSGPSSSNRPRIDLNFPPQPEPEPPEPSPEEEERRRDRELRASKE